MTEPLKNRYEAYFAGYHSGNEFEFMSLENVATEFTASYALGYIDGLEARRHHYPKPVKPEWMNEEQFSAVLKLYFRNQLVIPTFPEFLTKVEDYGDYCGLAWQGMFVGIEKDGYTHT